MLLGLSGLSTFEPLKTIITTKTIIIIIIITITKNNNSTLKFKEGAMLL
jgi:hypothetical protein